MLESFFNSIDNIVEDNKKEEPLLFILKIKKIIKNNKNKNLFDLFNPHYEGLFLILNNFNSVDFDINDYVIFDIQEYNSYINLLIKIFENKEEYERCHFFLSKKINIEY